MFQKAEEYQMVVPGSWAAERERLDKGASHPVSVVRTTLKGIGVQWLIE